MTTIRDCTQEDFEPVFGLLRQLWPDRELDRDATEEVFRHHLECDSRHYLCATNGEEVVGFCAFSVKRSLYDPDLLAYIDELVVEESRRREGIGAKLLERTREIAQHAGCSRVELDSAFHRESAHRFYEQRGFKAIGMLFRWDL